MELNRQRSSTLSPSQYANLIAQLNAQQAEMDAARSAEGLPPRDGRTIGQNDGMFTRQIQPLTPQSYLNNPQDYPFVARRAERVSSGLIPILPLAIPPGSPSYASERPNWPTDAMSRHHASHIGPGASPRAAEYLHGNGSHAPSPTSTASIDTIMRGLAGMPTGDAMSRHHAQPPMAPPAAPSQGPGMAQAAINAGGSGDIPALEAGSLIPQMASNFILPPRQMNPPVPNQALIPIPPTVNPPQLQAPAPEVQPTSFEPQAPVPGVSQNPLYGRPAGPMPPMPRPVGPQAQPINTRIPPLMRARLVVGNRPTQGSQQPSRAVAPQAPQAASIADEIQGMRALGKFNSGFNDYGADNIPPLPQSAPPPRPPASTPPSPPKGPVEVGTAIPGDTKDQIIAMALRAAFQKKAMQNAN